MHEFSMLGSLQHMHLPQSYLQLVRLMVSCALQCWSTHTRNRNVALATCMHINFGRLMFRLGATVYKIEWIPFFLFVARFGFCRQFDGFAVRPLRHFSSGVHRSALSLVMWSLGNAHYWWAGLLTAGLEAVLFSDRLVVWE